MWKRYEVFELWWNEDGDFILLCLLWLFLLGMWLSLLMFKNNMILLEYFVWEGLVFVKEIICVFSGVLWGDVYWLLLLWLFWMFVLGLLWWRL